MKRLIKKSKIYDGFKYKNKYYEVFKNPNLNEVREIKKFDSDNAIRGVILDNKDTYIWSANILHDINKVVSNKIDINQFRFAYEPGIGWIIDAHNSYDFDGITDLIIEYEDILYDIGDIDYDFNIYFYNGPRAKDVITLDKIKEYKLYCDEDDCEEDFNDSNYESDNNSNKSYLHDCFS